MENNLLSNTFPPAMADYGRNVESLTRQLQENGYNNDDIQLALMAAGAIPKPDNLPDEVKSALNLLYEQIPGIGNIRALEHAIASGNPEDVLAVIMPMMKTINSLGLDKAQHDILENKIKNNIEATQKGNESSNFGDLVAKEKELADSWNNTNQAHNASNYDKYKDLNINGMEKPAVTDSKLQGLVNDLYRDNAKIGSGSTADAVRHELATGETVGNKTHSEKAQIYSTALKNWLDKNPAASGGDRAAAENILKDMQNALNGK